MPSIVLLDTGTSFIAQQFQESNLESEIYRLDMYHLSEADLSGYSGMIVPGSVDQEWCFKHKDVFAGFLKERKVIAFSGAIFREWLPGVSRFVPKSIISHRDYALKIVKPEGIFNGVAAQDLTTRRGVSGFFARGHHPLPNNAEPLVTFESGEPVAYVDRASSPGTILLHSGNDLWSFGMEGTTSERLQPQLLQWMKNERESLRDGRD